jgi:cyanuric acid amidohydrolase
MTAVELLKAPMAAPDDVAALACLAERGLTPADVIAVVAKTEGNGCVNDFSRTLGARAWQDALAPSVVTVMSGGTEGVLSPHATLVTRVTDSAAPSGLAAATAETPPIAKGDIGRRAQVDAVAEAVRRAVAEAGMSRHDVHLALVKCPLLTSADVAAATAAGVDVVTSDTYESMARSRAASALGVALALGEATDDDVDTALAGTRDSWSSVASVSSGAELQNCHVLVLGSAQTPGRYRMAHTVMRDAVDAESVLGLLHQLGTPRNRIVQLFAKAEASPDGLVRGRRHTMLTDSDLQSTRHARAAVGGLLAGLTGDPCIYVSGGAEGQGPPGGGPVALVVDTL